MLHYFLRHASSEVLHAFFYQNHPIFLKTMDLQANGTVRIKQFETALEQLSSEQQLAINDDIDRMTQMTDDVGQAALHSIVAHASHLSALKSDVDRSLWLYTQHPDSFRHAEDVLYLDHYRYSRNWHGYRAETGLLIDEHSDAMAAFKQVLYETLSLTDKLIVDVFHRYMLGERSVRVCVVQIMIYQEGIPDSYLEFDEDDGLSRHVRCPVKEHGIVYNASTGVLEVTAAKQEQREAIAKAFASCLLKSNKPMQQVVLYQFDLSALRSPTALVFDKVDGIESVKLTLVKLRDPTTEMQLQFEVSPKNLRLIHDVMAETFKVDNPLTSSRFMLVKAKLHIRFRRQTGARNRSTLTFTVSLPDSCDLRGRTDRERLIIDKYFKQWGLLKPL